MTNSTKPVFNLWTKIADIFVPAKGALNGVVWGSGNSADGSDPIWVDNYVTDTATSTAPATYNIVLTSEDWVDSVQPEVVVATERLVNPFGPTGNLGAPMVFTSSDGVGQGGVAYWAPSTTKGEYALEYQTFDTNYVKAPSSTPNTTLSGQPVTLMSAVAAPTHWTVNWGSTDFVFSYTTKGSTANTEDIYFQAFTAEGVAESPLTEVATNVSSATSYYVAYSSGTGYYFDYSQISGSHGANSGWYQQSFNTTTGALGTAKEVVSLPGYTSIFGLSSHGLSDGSHIRMVEGIDGGKHVLQVFKSPSSGSTTLATTVALTGSASDRWSTAAVYDPADSNSSQSNNDYTALIVADNNKVTLRLFDANGDLIGSQFVIPGLTSFDRIHSLDSSRVEIDYTYANPAGGTQVGAYIYDTYTGSRAYTLTSDGEYIGSPGNDTITDGTGTFYVDGDGGTDTFIVPTAMYTASGVDITTNASGQIVVNSGANATTLAGFTYIDIDASATTTETITLGGTAKARTLTLAAAGDLVLGAPLASNYTLFVPRGSEIEVQTGDDLGAHLAHWQSGDSVNFDALAYTSGDTLKFVPGAGGVGGALELLGPPGAGAETLFHINAGVLKTADFTLVANGSGSEIKFA